MSETLQTLIKIENRRGAERVHLQYLKYLYNEVEIVNEDFEPDWLNCFNIMLPENNIENELEVILNTVASYLTHHNAIALKLAHNKNMLFVKTNKVAANV